MTKLKLNYCRFLSFVLLGYCFVGKSFAYIGFPPFFYLGEIALLLGLISAKKSQLALLLVSNRTGLLLALFLFWSALCTLPHLEQYGTAALRDGVLWGYSLFALFIAEITKKEGGFRNLLSPGFLHAAGYLWVWLLVVFILNKLNLVPIWSVSNFPLVATKAGDACVFLTGTALGFLLLLPKPAMHRVVIISLSALAFGAINRGGLLAFFAAFMVYAVLSGRLVRFAKLFSLVVAVILLLDLADFRIDDTRRSISAGQLITNVQSTFSKGKHSHLEATKLWRINWWSDIINYTFNGEHFWFGKGYGINLAVNDGRASRMHRDFKLRSPHSAHFTVLGRSGVPGFVLWVLLHGSWAWSLLAKIRSFKMKNDTRNANLGIFLLSFWTGLIINGSFDVFLEGPIGGIWFWTIFGLGLGYTSTPNPLGTSQKVSQRARAHPGDLTIHRASNLGRARFRNEPTAISKNENPEFIKR